MDLYNGNSRWYVKYHTKNVGNISGCFWPLPSKKCPDEKVKFQLPHRLQASKDPAFEIKIKCSQEVILPI